MSMSKKDESLNYSVTGRVRAHADQVSCCTRATAVIVSCCTGVRMVKYAKRNIMRTSSLTPLAQCVPVCRYEVRVVRRPLDRDLGFGGLDVCSHVHYRAFLAVPAGLPHTCILPL